MHNKQQSQTETWTAEGRGEKSVIYSPHSQQVEVIYT